MLGCAPERHRGSRAVALRPGQPTDAEALLAIHRRAILITGAHAYGPTLARSWAHGLSPDGYRRAMGEGGEQFVVAEMDGRLEGFCSYRQAEVMGLFVDPGAHGGGIGSALLRHAERAIEAEGGRTVQVNASLLGLPFYVRRGYVYVREFESTTRGGLLMRVVDMEKALI
jgi:putative acetyltransferase